MNLFLAQRILGIKSSMSQNIVKVSYKRLIKKWHPDKHDRDENKRKKAEERTKLINQAFKYIISHTTWEKRKKINKNKINIKLMLLKIAKLLLVFSQYILIVIGIPFIIFWYHPIHNDLFPFCFRYISSQY